MKLGVVGLVAAVLVAFAAFGLGGPAANAEVTGSGVSGGRSPVDNTNGVWTVTEQGIDPAVGTTLPQEDCAKGVNSDPAASGSVTSLASSGGAALRVNTTNYPNPSVVGTLPTIILSTSSSLGNSVILCVNADDGDGELSFDANNATDVGATGTFTKPSCSLSTTIPAVHDGDVRVAEWPDDSCADPTGVNTGHMIVPDGPLTCQANAGVCDNDLDVVMAVYTCPSVASVITVTVGQDQSQVRFQILCRGQASGITITATPTTVEIVPAPSNTAHSLIQVTATDSAGNPIGIVGGQEVDFTVNQGTLLGTGPLGLCAIEAAPFTVSSTNSIDQFDAEDNILTARQVISQLTTAQPATYLNWDDFANEGPNGLSITESNAFLPDLTPTVDQTFLVDTEIAPGLVRGMAAAILHCDVHPGVATPTPGFVTVQACLDVINAADICRQVQVTVIGPPASVTVAASPTSVRCGEKSTITVTVKDAVGQNVSDHTVVELVSNLGGTIGGTGAVAGFAAPVTPISSSVAGTFGGVATAFLLTSETHTGPYEVVATTGGTDPQNFVTLFNPVADSPVDFSDLSVRQSILGGIFSTPPISAQVTVTCSLPSPTVAAPAATVTAPRTGTGVLPPNTGDAGLKDSSSSWALFAIAGMAAFALAGLASVKFARR